jgi:hypothetical protein
MSLLMTAGTLSADTFDINVNFGGGVTGTGSFNTNGTCGICIAGDGMTNFTFTVDDDTFTEAAAVAARLTYFPHDNTLDCCLGTLIQPGDARDTLQFMPQVTAGGLLETAIDFFDSEDTTGHHTATATISAVPEPTSLALLAGVIGWVVFDLKRRFRKKSAIH